MKLRLIPITLVIGALVTACDDDPAGLDFPDLLGTYDASWSFIFTAGSFGSFTGECSGTVTITDQEDEEFSGTFTTIASDDCDTSSGTLEGEVRGDGGLNFVIDIPGEDEDLEAITPCEVVTADNQLNGTFVNDVIDADADAVLDCPTEFGVLRVSLELDLFATKD